MHFTILIFSTRWICCLECRTFINCSNLLISVREIRKHSEEDVEKDQDSSRWKKIWRAIARRAKRKKNWRKSLKKRNYHTLMTTQKRHRFFSFYNMYFYRKKVGSREHLFFLTFRRTVVRRCKGTFIILLLPFNQLQYTQHSSQHWLKNLQKDLKSGNMKHIFVYDA